MAEETEPAAADVAGPPAQRATVPQAWMAIVAAVRGYPCTADERDRLNEATRLVGAVLQAKLTPPAAGGNRGDRRAAAKAKPPARKAPAKKPVRPRKTAERR